MIWYYSKLSKDIPTLDPLSDDNDVIFLTNHRQRSQRWPTLPLLLGCNERPTVAARKLWKDEINNEVEKLYCGKSEVRGLLDNEAINFTSRIVSAQHEAVWCLALVCGMRPDSIVKSQFHPDVFRSHPDVFRSGKIVCSCVLQTKKVYPQALQNIGDMLTGFRKYDQGCF